MSNKAKEKYEQQGVAMTCRSFKEYMDMFMLEEEGLRGPVLDVAAGASSFTRELNKKDIFTVAVDPLYKNTPETLEQRGFREIEEAADKLDQVSHLYHWNYYDSIENHRNHRQVSLSLFIEDFKSDRCRGRYVAGALPHLPFPDETFSLVLCNHFLFLYEEQFDPEFHYAAVKELLRICKKDGEVRIYPLVGFDGKVYRQLKALENRLRQDGVTVEYIDTNFRFLKEATQVLKLENRETANSD